MLAYPHRVGGMPYDNWPQPNRCKRLLFFFLQSVAHRDILTAMVTFVSQRNFVDSDKI